MAMSKAERNEIDALFDGGEFIPAEILLVVKKMLFVARRQYHLNHETFRDLIQTCLMKIWVLEGEFKSKPVAYFAQLVNNTIADCCRKQAKLARMDSKPDEFFSFNEREVMNDALRQMYSKVDLDALIHSVLDDEEAAVFILRFYQGLTLNQISVLLELKLSKVKRRHSDAIQKLRGNLRSVAFRKA